MGNLLSPIGFKAFICDLGTAGTEGATYKKLVGLHNASPFSKNRKTEQVDLLDNDGYSETVYLGQYYDDVNIVLYVKKGDDTYDFFKEWDEISVSTEEALKDLVYCTSNGDGTYRVEVGTVGIKKLSDIAGDPSKGQQYTVTFGVSGKVNRFHGTIIDDVPTLTPINDNSNVVTEQ